MVQKIGLIVGREWSWPPAFIEEVNRRGAGVVAEYVKLGAPAMDDPVEYAVVVDRISHEVPFYRTWLKHAALRGTTVINNPFMWSSDDKFFGATLATSLGIAHPKTALLPNKEYIPGIKHDESLKQPRVPARLEGRGRVRGPAAHPQGRLRRRLARRVRLPHHGRPAPALQRVGAAHHDRPGVHQVRAVHPLRLHRAGGHPADPVRPEGAEVPQRSRLPRRPGSATRS